MCNTIYLLALCICLILLIHLSISHFSLSISFSLTLSLSLTFFSAPLSMSEHVASEMAKPVQPMAPAHAGGGRLPEQQQHPDERDNEIIIELDRDNQYSRTQPRANEPQGKLIPNHGSFFFAHFSSLGFVESSAWPRERRAARYIVILS